MKDVNILINNGANIKKALELFGHMMQHLKLSYKKFLEN